MTSSRSHGLALARLALLSLAALQTAVLTSLAVGCSSSTATGGGTASDAGTEASATSCPPGTAGAPKDGTACGAEGLVCEYGTATVQACDTVATCTGAAAGSAVKDQWVLTGITPGPVCQGGSGTACPASFKAVPVGQHCTLYETNCDYPEGRCACTTRSGPTVIDASAQATWICPSPDPSCPLPRPRLGTPCTATVECDYGTCAIPGATAQSCTGGVWTEANTACPK